MGRQYHIITCDSEDIRTRFIQYGFVGIRPVLTKSADTGRTVRMNWDILADLARVKEGDYILLHTKGSITGVFEVNGDPVVDAGLLYLFDGQNVNTSTWNNNWGTVTTTVNSGNFVWWIPITPIDDLYFKEMPMDPLFNDIARGRITSLPPRLRYEDKNKAIKGVTRKDFERIIDLFENYSQPDTPIAGQPPLVNFAPMTFDTFQDGYEKNLEAVLVHRIRKGTLTISGIDFRHSHVLNTVPLGYLKMADILTWNERRGRIINPWIWELKVGSLNWTTLREELKKLAVRASYLDQFFGADQGDFKVTGVIVAENFTINRRAFKDLITPIGTMEEIILIKYTKSGTTLSFRLFDKI